MLIEAEHGPDSSTFLLTDSETVANEAISFLLFIESIVPYVFNTTPEGLEIAVIMHYAIAPLFLMMGLVAFFATTFELESKRKVIQQ